ncbi:NUDIX hydrolase [bacterium]|nr:NUDIX hydrolase [bacterium]
MQKYETFEKALVREVKEETNLDVDPEDCCVVNIANTFDLESKTHFIQI